MVLGIVMIVVGTGLGFSGLDYRNLWSKQNLSQIGLVLIGAGTLVTWFLGP